MGNYLERLCIFICLGDLLANFLPSPKFEKLYRYVAGALILLLVLNPMGKEVSKLLEKGEGGIRESFEERMAEQNRLWKEMDGGKAGETSEALIDAYMKSFTDEEMREELEQYGYETEESDDGKMETTVR